MRQAVSPPSRPQDEARRSYRQRTRGCAGHNSDPGQISCAFASTRLPGSAHRTATAAGTRRSTRPGRSPPNRLSAGRVVPAAAPGPVRVPCGWIGIGTDPGAPRSCRASFRVSLSPITDSPAGDWPSSRVTGMSAAFAAHLQEGPHRRDVGPLPCPGFAAVACRPCSRYVTSPAHTHVQHIATARSAWRRLEKRLRPKGRISRSRTRL